MPIETKFASHAAIEKEQNLESRIERFREPQTGRLLDWPRLTSTRAVSFESYFVTAIMSRVTVLFGTPTPLTLALLAAGGRSGLKNCGRMSLSLLPAKSSET
jgi:hypothetical protein